MDSLHDVHVDGRNNFPHGLNGSLYNLLIKNVSRNNPLTSDEAQVCLTLWMLVSHLIFIFFLGTSIISGNVNYRTVAVLASICQERENLN